jgi:hypothetical protein
MLDGIGKGEGWEDCAFEDAEVDEVLSGVNVLICLLRDHVVLPAFRGDQSPGRSAASPKP